jgi:hypothetical protein
MNIENCTSDEPYGFWFGLWHGIISPISFFGKVDGMISALCWEREFYLVEAVRRVAKKADEVGDSRIIY